VPINKINFEEVEDLPSSTRGKGGFGSTGKWKNN
jgi:dUTPase